MRRLRLPQFPARPSASSSVGPGGLWLTSLLRSPRPGSPRPARLGVINRFHPLSGLWSTRDLRLSQVPREPHCAYALLLDSGRALVPSLHGTSVLPPVNGTRRAPTTTRDFGALSHGLSTGCLRFVPPSLATTQNSLPGGRQPFPGGIPLYPLSSIGRFPPFGFPFPWASLGATRIIPVYSNLNIRGLYGDTTAW